MKPPSGDNPRSTTPAQLAAMTRRDRNKLFLLGIAALLLGAGYFGTRLTKGRYERAQAEQVPTAELPEEPSVQQVQTLPFEDGEILATIRDATPEERLAISDQALTALLYYSMYLAPLNYEALGIRDLDAALCAEVAADPGSQRVAPFRARGWLEAFGKRRRDPDQPEEHWGALRLEDDAFVHVAFITPPEWEIAVGDFVRLDGVFVQIHRGEAGGVLREGPLLAGRNVLRSVPRCEAKDERTLRAELLRDVADDTLDDVSGIPEGPFWDLMAYAHEHGDEVNWDEALELNDGILRNLLADGEAFRGVPFRFPICPNLDSRTKRARENCLRLERVTEGWVGNFMWKAVPAVKWTGPFVKEELSDRYGAARLLTARGFFLKNHYFTTGGGAPGRAPFFVVHDVQIFTPIVDRRPQMLLFGVAVGTLAMVALIWFLLRRDRRSSERLAAELIRRRRARVAKEAAASSVEASPEAQ